MEQCSDCDKDIPEDEVTHCLYCSAPLCEDCEVGGLCSNCAQIVEAEEVGFW